MKDFGAAYVQRQERKADERTNLRAGRHTLHLLLTVFTCGLWLPVWIIRSIRGNPRRTRTRLTAIGRATADRAEPLPRCGSQADS